MKLMHLSDLHLGKILNGYSLYEDQKYILEQILQTAKDEKPDAAAIAGDVYDRDNPSAEAVSLFNDFLTRLRAIVPNVLIVRGNHDNAVRLSFASELLSANAVHITPVYTGEITKVTLADEYGDVDFYLLPYVKPSAIRKYKERECKSEEDSVRIALEDIDTKGRRSVLIAHQFAEGGMSAGSEDTPFFTNSVVGNLGGVSAELFKQFDYTALGHLHRAQNLSYNVRYCGTPLKYSQTEANQTKSVTIVELKQKGEAEIREIELTPQHELREIRGSFCDLCDADRATEDYVYAILTDEEPVRDAAYRLSAVYPRLLGVRNECDLLYQEIPVPNARPLASPADIFEEFYRESTGIDLTDEQKKLCAEIFEECRKEANE